LQLSAEPDPPRFLWDSPRGPMMGWRRGGRGRR